MALALTGVLTSVLLEPVLRSNYEIRKGEWRRITPEGAYAKSSTILLAFDNEGAETMGGKSRELDRLPEWGRRGKDGSAENSGADSLEGRQLRQGPDLPDCPSLPIL